MIFEVILAISAVEWKPEKSVISLVATITARIVPTLKERFFIKSFKYFIKTFAHAD